MVSPRWREFLQMERVPLGEESSPQLGRRGRWTRRRSYKQFDKEEKGKERLQRNIEEVLAGRHSHDSGSEDGGATTPVLNKTKKEEEEEELGVLSGS